jgi:hypothetical protein
MNILAVIIRETAISTTGEEPVGEPLSQSRHGGEEKYPDPKELSLYLLTYKLYRKL